MSAISTAVWQETCKVCDAIYKSVHNTIVQMQRNRQLSANRQIMYHLDIQFIRDQDLPFHLDQMNDFTNKEYDAKLIK